MHTIQLSNQLHNLVAMLKNSNQAELNAAEVSQVEFQAIKKIFLQAEKKVNVALTAWT